MSEAGSDIRPGTLKGSGRRGAGSRGRDFHRLLALLALTLGVYLPGFFSLPVVDRDEPRFAQASRTMAQQGDYTIPMLRGVPRLNKPPFIYWAQAASARLFTGGDLSRDAIWMYRVPSLLAGIFAVLLTWRLGCSMFDPRVGFWAACLLAVCPVIAWETHQARADMVLLAFSTASIWLLWECLRGPSLPRALALWIAVGFGVLVKGPVTPMIILLGLAAWAVATRRPRELRKVHPFLGLLVLIAMVAPWVLLVVQRVGWETYWSTVRGETLGRSLSASEDHGGFPGIHTLGAFLFFFPASLWLPGALWRSARKGWTRGRHLPRAGRPQECFLLCLLVPSWIVFELVRTRLPHYTMPLYPILALLVARASLARTATLRLWLAQKWVGVGARLWMAIPPLLCIAVGGLGWLQIHDGGTFGWLVITAAAAALAGFTLATRNTIASRRLLRTLQASWCLAVVLLILIGATLPRLQTPWVVDRLCRAAAQLSAGAPRDLAFAGLYEDSSTFLTRGKASWIQPPDVDRYLHDHPDALLALPASLAREHGLDVKAGVRGFNYSKGQLSEWVIAERRP